jgi:hypothetical protein
MASILVVSTRIEADSRAVLFFAGGFGGALACVVVGATPLVGALSLLDVVAVFN